MTFRQPHAARASHPIEELYQAHALTLTRFALLLVGDKATAEDVVQDAFLGLYRNWDGLREQSGVFGYLRIAVLNGSRSVLRTRARRFRHVQHEPPAWSAEAAVLDREDRREVLVAVAGLPRRQREVLALKFYLELGEEEIARTLRVSRGTVSSTASRALAALARLLEEEQ
ncbi:MAG TPA: sigma-70 family RNA polymerase sigma factor [Streptosporangiaceae bacterium]|nr:sigma-70 family RNA polymerase sigma factor [Streptosporangiaceae bacterium]